MKKPKISLDKDKIQAFFLHHIEKILLVVVVGLMLLLIARGFNLPHLDHTFSPQGLVSKSNDAKTMIDNPERWNEVSTLRMPVFNVEKGVTEVLKKSDPLAYMLVNSWSRPDFPKLSPREDPELFAPINLIARPVIGPLASYPGPTETYIDPLFPAEDEAALKAKREKAKRDAKKKAAELATAGGEYGEEGAMPTRGRPKRQPKGKAGEATGLAGGMTPMPGGSGEYEGGYGGMYGGYGGMAGDKYPEAMTVGFAVQNPEQTIARNLASITIMAVVPLQKQVEEFEKKLSNSLDYDPKRDYPFYMDYRVQRADVTDVDPATEVEKLPWQPLPAPASVLAKVFGNETTPGLYAGIPPEVVDPTYCSEQLTHPAPPYLQRDLWDLLTHPDVPLATMTMGYDPGLAAAGTTPAAKPGDDDAPTLPMAGPGGMAGGFGGAAGTTDGGYGGGMRGGFGGGGFGGGMRGSASEGAMTMGGGYGGGMRGGGYMPRSAGGGYGGMSGGEESGGYGTYGGGMQTYTPPKHQLIRFTDTDVEPGRKYRYRIRVYMLDPNHPNLQMGYIAPSAASLHEDVRKRVKALDEADAKRGKDANGYPWRTYWVMTPWSEPTEITGVPRPERIYAVKVSPRAPTMIKGIPVPMAEPTADALAVVFDRSKIADIPAQNDRIARGSVLNFVSDTKVIHPVTKEVVEMPKYNVATNALVADLMGGEPIRAVDSKASPQPLTTLGEMLIVDSDGRLHVQNEAQDILNFRRFTVPKPDPKAAAAAAAGSADGYMPGGEDGGRPPRGARGRLP